MEWSEASGTHSTLLLCRVGSVPDAVLVGSRLLVVCIFHRGRSGVRRDAGDPARKVGRCVETCKGATTQAYVADWEGRCVVVFEGGRHVVDVQRL